MNKEIRGVYVLILTVFFLSGLATAIRTVFKVSVGVDQLYLICIFLVVLGFAFTFEKQIAIILCSIVILMYAAWLYYIVYNGKISSDTLIGYYIWFFNFPIGVLIGGEIKTKIDRIQFLVSEAYRTKEIFSVRDPITLFKNKREFLYNILVIIEHFRRRNVVSSAILIEITDFKLLYSELNVNELEEFHRYFSKALLKVTRSDEEKYFLGDGDFGIILRDVNDEELKNAIANIKMRLTEETKYPDPKTGVKYIPFKISGVAIKNASIGEFEIFKQLKRGLEYDV